MFNLFVFSTLEVFSLLKEKNNVWTHLHNCVEKQQKKSKRFFFICILFRISFSKKHLRKGTQSTKIWQQQQQQQRDVSFSQDRLEKLLNEMRIQFRMNSKLLSLCVFHSKITRTTRFSSIDSRQYETKTSTSQCSTYLRDRTESTR